VVTATSSKKRGVPTWSRVAFTLSCDLAIARKRVMLMPCATNIWDSAGSGDDRVAGATVGDSDLDIADVLDGDPVGTRYGHVVLASCGIGARVPRERVSGDHTKGVMS
jgi:hypothetical protein